MMHSVIKKPQILIALDRIGGTQMSGIIEGAVPVMQLVMTVHVLCCNVLYILYCTLDCIVAYCQGVQLKTYGNRNIPFECIFSLLTHNYT